MTIDIERLKWDESVWPGGATHWCVVNERWIFDGGDNDPCCIPRPKPQPANEWVDGMPQWDGKECPPQIGSVCECTFAIEHHDTWHQGEVVFRGIDPEGREFFIVDTKVYQACYRSLDHVRPLHTKAERQREELIKVMDDARRNGVAGDLLTMVADAILSKYNLTEK